MKKSAKAPVTSPIDAYIAEFPDNVQAILQKIRTVANQAAPGAEEVISYRMPALRLNGILLYFAAFKNHIGLYPPVRGDESLEQALAKYAGEKGNLKFPLDRPIPYPLIKRIVQLRVRQNAEKGAARKGSRGSRTG